MGWMRGHEEALSSELARELSILRGQWEVNLRGMSYQNCFAALLREHILNYAPNPEMPDVVCWRVCSVV